VKRTTQCGGVSSVGSEHGIKFLPREGRHQLDGFLPHAPEGKHSKDVVGAAEAAGWTIGAARALKDSTIRIGHMGDHTVARWTSCCR